MSSNKTTNYQLHSWEPGDDFLRTEFNENFAKLDGAVYDRFVIGSYQGNHSSVDDPVTQIITLGFCPRAVFIIPQDGKSSGYYGGLATPDLPTKRNTDVAIEVLATGFQVRSNSYVSTNSKSIIYYYMSIR